MAARWQLSGFAQVGIANDRENGTVRKLEHSDEAVWGDPSFEVGEILAIVRILHFDVLSLFRISTRKHVP